MIRTLSVGMIMISRNQEFRLVVTLIIVTMAIVPYLTSFNILASSSTPLIGSGSNVDYLIITSEDFLPELQLLVAWKQQRGLSTAIVTVEDILQEYSGRGNPEKIRNCIIHYYEEEGVTWVLLAGNQGQVPVKYFRIEGQNIVSDYYYANLDDDWIKSKDSGYDSINDFYDGEAEVYVGRLPANSKSGMKELVEQLVDYERNPPVGSWMTRAVLVGAYANFDTDENGNNLLDFSKYDANRFNNWIKSNVLPANWSSTLLAETEGIKPTDYYYDKSITEENIVEEINNGCGMALFDSHGWPNRMTRWIFANDYDNDSLYDLDVDTLSSATYIDIESEIDTQGKRGVYYLSACETGNFYSRTFTASGLSYDESFSEFILRTSGIGVIASSAVGYYEPGWYERDHSGWYAQGLSSRFWQQLLQENNNQPGKALAEAKNAYAIFARDSYTQGHVAPQDEFKDTTIVQFNLLGDPEVPVWTVVPSQLELQTIASDNQLILEASADEQLAVDVTVTLMNSTYYWKGLTDESGHVNVPLREYELEHLTLTLSRNNNLPYQELAPNGMTPYDSNVDTNIDPLSSSAYTPLPVMVVIAIYLGRKRKK
ncbi:MAG: C25 family cysteine peptidase [Candidatus Hodarchaeales archaeon]